MQKIYKSSEKERRDEKKNELLESYWKQAWMSTAKDPQWQSFDDSMNEKRGPQKLFEHAREFPKLIEFCLSTCKLSIRFIQKI